MKPLLNVVDSVFDPWLTGVASPLVRCLTAFSAVRLRRLCCRLRASRREAMAGERREMDRMAVRLWGGSFARLVLQDVVVGGIGFEAGMVT